MNYNDTIAAICTATSNGGVSIIRISGDNAVKVCEDVLAFKSGKLGDKKSHSVNYGYVVDKFGDKIDEVLVLLMLSPRSYTREDVVEIQCHGGVTVCHEILDRIIECGARVAEPGEFTKRAFLNGRIDLSQAEAVMDIIESKSRIAMKSSMSQLQGSIKNHIICLRQDMMDKMAYIEAALDDPEHISLDDFGEGFEKDLDRWLEDVHELIEKSKNRKIIKDGINTVIVGKPNVGKSSFLNYLCGSDVAIVTDIPGTTRDVISEDVRLTDISLHITDTAGIRETDDVIEKIGVEKANRAMEDADICILVMDISDPIDDEDVELMRKCGNTPMLVLLNKNDLSPAITQEDIRQYTDAPIIEFSTVNRTGLRDLENEIKKIFDLNNLNFHDEIYITNERQRGELLSAYSSLKALKESVENDMFEDFYTYDLMDAYSSLGKMIGESVEDDLAETIFTKFCMGK